MGGETPCLRQALEARASQGLNILRIGYVVSYFHPFASGAERQALEQGRELARRGHTVHVLTRAVPGYPIDDEEYDGIFIHRWIRTIDFGPCFGLSFVAGVRRGLRRFGSQLDVIHTHQGLWEAVATGLARPRRGGIPTLVQPASSGHFGEAEELQRTRGAGLLRRIILENSAFAAISSDIESQWRALGVEPERLVRVASGVNTERFCPGSSAVESSLPPRPRVLFTGRLHPQKNLPVLLEAWTEVVRRSPAHLILLGPGTDRVPLMGLAESLGISERVWFLEAVSDPSDYLRAADVFVLPSVAEGMSNSLLEAMATALPCVVSGIGGNTDLITDRKTGRLVDASNPKAWAATLLETLEHSDEARQLGAAARRRVEAEFSLSAVVDRYLDIYRRLVERTWPG